MLYTVAGERKGFVKKQRGSVVHNSKAPSLIHLPAALDIKDELIFVQFRRSKNPIDISSTGDQ